jgi:hypothetical protein
MAKDGYPMEPTRVDHETWATPATAWDVRKFSDIEVQFVSAPSTPYQPQRSLDGTNYVNCNAYDASGATLTTITAAGIYSFDGNCYLKFSAGAGSTLTRRAAA